MKQQQIAVIGLGRFGSAVAEELVKAGHDVLGIDSELSVVQQMANRLSHVVQADAVDQQALEQLGLQDFDAGVVAITQHIETSILTTLLLKRMGVRQVLAKARNDLHGEILTRVGADRVIYPERDSGLRLAHSWASADITDSLDIIEGYVVSRVQVPAGLVGRAVGEAITDRENGVALLLLARGSSVIELPSPQEQLQAGDILVLSGQIEELDQFFSTIS